MKTLQAIPIKPKDPDFTGIKNEEELSDQITECLEENQRFVLDLTDVKDWCYRIFKPFIYNGWNSIDWEIPQNVWVEGPNNPWSERPTEPGWTNLRDAEKLQRLMTIQGNDKAAKSIQFEFERSKSALEKNAKIVESYKLQRAEVDLILEKNNHRPLDVLEFVLRTQRGKALRRTIVELRKHYGVPTPAQRRKIREKEERAAARKAAMDPTKKKKPKLATTR